MSNYAPIFFTPRGGGGVGNFLAPVEVGSKIFERVKPKNCRPPLLVINEHSHNVMCVVRVAYLIVPKIRHERGTRWRGYFGLHI